MIAGFMLGAAEQRMLVMVDGFIASSAALVAAQLAPAALDYFVFSHLSAESGHVHALRTLEVKPLLDLGLRLGEGTGAVLAWPLVVSAVKLLEEMATFESAGVSGKAETEPAPSK
jgi:nicotinate-nucleotide--dimethylbenzimidazole phosphoribosyltransferase